MESQPQNPEFRNNPENFHPCFYSVAFISLFCHPDLDPNCLQRLSADDKSRH